MLRLIDTYKIPTYAISAIVNDDYSGLDDEDEQNIREFMASFENGFIADWDKHIDEPYFEPFPVFGKACDVIDVDFYEGKPI